MERILSWLMAIALVLLLLPTTQADRAEPGFDDVAGLPCETAAGALYQAGIVSGTAPHIFTPDSTLTRAQMATILVRAYAQEVAGEGKTFDGCTGKPLGLFLHCIRFCSWADLRG